MYCLIHYLSILHWRTFISQPRKRLRPRQASQLHAALLCLMKVNYQRRVPPPSTLPPPPLLLSLDGRPSGSRNVIVWPTSLRERRPCSIALRSPTTRIAMRDGSRYWLATRLTSETVTARTRVMKLLK